jgi:DNA polymerase
MQSTPKAQHVKRLLQADRLFGMTSVPTPLVLRRPAGGASKGAGVSSMGASIGDVSVESKRTQLDVLDREQVKGCTKCRLCEGRTNTVFGDGDANARLMFIGEGPGFDEDRQGVPFVGRAGQLLDKMIIAMGLKREEVYICNIVKCRPPNNRDPAADEVIACTPYLQEQVRIVEPEVIVALGSPASKTLLDTQMSIGKLRGRFHDYHYTNLVGEVAGISLMPTYHPAYLLRTPQEKKKTWDDLQMVMQLLGLPVRTSR